MWGSARRGEEEERDCLWQFSRCPACNLGYNDALILPCSHPMCARCVASGEEAGSSRSLLCARPQPKCTLPCPCCRRPVELPCRDWSSAVSCLPRHPTLTSRHDDGDTARKTPLPGDEWNQGVTCDEAQPHCSRAVSSSNTPSDGTIDLRQEEMEQSVYGLRFALDPSAAHPSLHLSNSAFTVTYFEDDHPTSGHERKTPNSLADPETLPGVCADVLLERGQYYWEVDVCNSSFYRIGVTSADGASGWWLQRHNLSHCVVYDGRREALRTVPPQIKTLGVFLNLGGGALSFYNPLTREHLATLPTRFGPAGVIPALRLGRGKLRLRCGLPPPPHVFFGKDSAYRGPCFGRRTDWRRQVFFQPFKEVIRKFEALALTPSDRGSGFGLSSSTLNSRLGSGTPASFSGVQQRQEAECE